MIHDMASNAPPPYALAMVICDAIHRDPATGKHTILGTFSSIAALDFPVRHPGMGVFISLTDGRGITPLTLKLVSADENVRIFEAGLEVDFEDPRMVLELATNIGNIEFPQPGEYRLQLFAGDEPLMERRLVVVQAKQR